MNIQTRDQQRATHAYACAAQVALTLQRSDYKVVVNTFGAAVVHSGLLVALAFVKRYKNGALADLFLDHLVRADLLGLPENTSADNLISNLCQATMASYILATRECLHVIIWFRRAVQTWPDDASAEHMRLKHGNRAVIDAPMHKSRLERVRALLGSRMGRRIHRVSGQEHGIEVDAYLSTMPYIRARKKTS